MIEALRIRGVSDEAHLIAKESLRSQLQLYESTVNRIWIVLEGELAVVMDECQHPNWDGYDALPVSVNALKKMRTFLECLPFGFPCPSISADPSGCLSVEWYRNPRRVLSVSVGNDDLLHYAALLGPNKVCGTEAYFGEAPDCILDLVRRLYS